MGSPQAAEHLRGLLSRPGPYRQAWVSQALTSPGSELDRAAVCRVIAEHLWDSGLRSERETGLARSLRDRVRRALSGELLTPTTLSWFTDAFAMDDRDRERLTALLSGSQGVRAIVRDESAPLAVPRHPDYRTLSVHDYHWVGADRRPTRHEAIQVIESLIDGLRSYRYRFDTDTLAVDVLSGGRPSGIVQPEGRGLYGMDIDLTRTLTRGETASLRFVSYFGYRHPPAPVLRRMVPTRMDSVDMHVVFDPANPPHTVRLCRWRALDGEAEVISEMALDAECAVHNFFDVVENAIVGFQWFWD